MHLVAVPTFIAATKVQRLMHVADKVNEKLERLLGGARSTIIRHEGRRQRAAGKVGQDGADVVYGVEDVGELGARPAVRAGELAVVRRVVAHAFGVVQRGGPVRAEADLVGPGGDRREVARRVGVDIAVGTEDGADGVQCSWVEVRLGEGGDDFVAFFFEVGWRGRGISEVWGGWETWGKTYLLRPRLSRLGGCSSQLGRLLRTFA